jgi:acetoacetate decarboxylase
MRRVFASGLANTKLSLEGARTVGAIDSTHAIKVHEFARGILDDLEQGPYPLDLCRFVSREIFVLTYRTHAEELRALVPEPLETMQIPLVKQQFIGTRYSTGCYSESSQVIPVICRGRRGAYVHSMYVNEQTAITSGRDLWGLPTNFGNASLNADHETVLGALDYRGMRVARATMGRKHGALDMEAVRAALAEPNYVLEIIPHVDGTPSICRLVRYCLEDVAIRAAWTGPASLELSHHALAPVARLPVGEVVSGLYLVADMTLGSRTVVHDYLARDRAYANASRPARPSEVVHRPRRPSST